MPDLRHDITAALADFLALPLKDASRHLLARLGYKSDKFLAGAGSQPQDFLNDFASGNPLDEEKALVAEWKSADLIFQLTDEELSRHVSSQGSLFTDDSVQRSLLKSYVFIAIELREVNYARGKFSAIARQINRLFPMPVMVLFKHGERLTIAVINRRRNKIDESKDVLEKATLIRDVSIPNPHRGHLDILASLALHNLVHPEKKPITDFDTLHTAWEQIFNVELLNERFYRELSNWYFWALPQVEFPADLEPDDEKRRATGLIRLLTRLIFCWFLKEKGLIPEKLFHPTDLASLLKGFDPESETSSTYYQAILQNLFFATLNQRMGKPNEKDAKPYRAFVPDEGFLKNRTNHDLNQYYRYEKLFNCTQEEALALFEDIPFLNGGLFECLDKRDEEKKETRYLDGFSRNAKKRPHVPDRLFFDSGEIADLSEVYDDKKRKTERVTGLITILNRYKFTIVENTPIDQEIALDPELLGKVFENLLASYNEETKTTARKQTGSFYTPRPIVDYMVDESLKAHLTRCLTEKAGMKEDDAKAGLDLLFTYTEKEHPFSEQEVSALITAIDEVKILDPACGSGAFPMGVLHKLVYILGKLDPDNERWKQTQLAKLDSAPMREAREAAFEDNNDDYGRKLYLIENCLYGVDIQPIAIQITKLRFFISLVCDQKTNRNKKDNHGIRPLPNLETKFVAANTLIGLPIRDFDNRDFLYETNVAPLEKEIEAAYHNHFTIQRRDQKLALQRKIQGLRQKLADTLLEGLGAKEGSAVAKKAQHLAEWDPFDPQHTADFFDPQWMFGRSLKDGFDIVIANPPYLKERDNKNVFAQVDGTQLSELYHDGKMDFWYYFLHRAIDISKKGNGLICFITSRYWINSRGARKLIKRIKEELSFVSILDIGTLKVFDAVAGHHMVALYGKSHNRNQVPLVRITDSVSHLANSEASEYVEKTVLNRGSIISDSYEIVLGNNRIKIAGSIPLGELCEISQGVVEAPDKVSRKQIAQSGRNDLTVGTGVFVLAEDEVKKLNLNNSELSVLKKYLDPQDIGRFWIAPKRQKFLIYSDRETKIRIGAKQEFGTLKKHLDQLAAVITSSNGPYGLHRPREARFFESPKILFPSMFSKACFAIDEDKFYVGMSFSVVIAKNADIDLKFILAILNSNWAVNWFYANGKHRGSGVDIGVEKLRSFPVPAADVAAKQSIINLTNKIIAKKKISPSADTNALEREIDQQVYALYGLTPEEIAIVEGSAP